MWGHENINVQNIHILNVLIHFFWTAWPILIFLKNVYLQNSPFKNRLREMFFFRQQCIWPRRYICKVDLVGSIAKCVLSVWFIQLWSLFLVYLIAWRKSECMLFAHKTHRALVAFKFAWCEQITLILHFTHSSALVCAIKDVSLYTLKRTRAEWTVCMMITNTYNSKSGNTWCKSAVTLITRQ